GAEGGERRAISDAPLCSEISACPVLVLYQSTSPKTVAGTGDFNGDGKSDLLWLNTSTGQAVIWLLNGTSVSGGGSPGSAASPWTIAETGDFNGDSKNAGADRAPALGIGRLAARASG